MKEKINKTIEDVKRIDTKSNKMIKIPDFMRLLTLRKEYDKKIASAKSADEIDHLIEQYKVERERCKKSGIKAVKITVGIAIIVKFLQSMMFICDNVINSRKSEQKIAFLNEADRVREYYAKKQDAFLKNIVLSDKEDTKEGIEKLREIINAESIEINKLKKKYKL